MFFAELQALQAAHEKQLQITYVLSNNTSAPLGINGRLDNALLQSLMTITVNTEVYCCGPEGLQDTVVSTLNNSVIASHRLHLEQFISITPEPDGELYQVDVCLNDGEQYILAVAANQTVLEVAKACGVRLPHACGNGSCKFKVKQGQVASIAKSIPGITLDEIKANLTLACQCKPLSNITLVEAKA